MQTAANGSQKDKDGARGGGSTKTHAPPAGRVELQWLAAKRDRSRSRRRWGPGGRGRRKRLEESVRGAAGAREEGAQQTRGCERGVW